MILDLLRAIIPVFLIMGTGFLFFRCRWMDPGLETGMMRLNLNLLYPCLIVDKVIGDPALSRFANVASAITSGAVIISLGLGISLGFASLLRFDRGEGKRTFALTCGIHNYGFIALPVLLAMFGEEPLGLLFLHGMGVEIAIWTFGIMILRGAGGANARAVINGPFIGVVLGLALHYLGAEAWLPSPGRVAIAAFGTCAIPVALFTIGATIAHQAMSQPWSFDLRTLAGATILRLVLLPALILAAAAFLPLGTQLRQVLLVQASMPAAVMPIILARLYGGHPGTAIQIVLGTTLLSLATMPLILTWGRQWLGL